MRDFGYVKLSLQPTKDSKKSVYKPYMYSKKSVYNPHLHFKKFKIYQHPQ
jgi:hypothetical protein